METNGIIYHPRYQMIAYGDDLTIITRSRRELNADEIPEIQKRITK